MNPREVDIPGPLVDYVIISPKQYHCQCGTIEYDPRISYRIVPPITEKLVEAVTTQPSNVYEKVIARRILLELIEVFKEKRTPVLVNLGIGIPALVSSVGSRREHK